MSILVTFPSAGHYTNDPGAIYNGRKENFETMDFRNRLTYHLDKIGVKYITDKDHETNRQYQNRIKPGKGSVLLDIHFNAGPITATGTECFIARNASAQSREMAGEICQTASKLMGIPNRGVKVETQTRHGRLGILNLGAGIAVLWEICFISNPNDMAKYDAVKEQLAIEIAKICKKYDDLI
ncbi:N-acetylmuramoyl-L-alanine amidase [Riemerella anatipestifer]|nr:N-acetylmuramoyl-L-alanine amidase [Riemerella anatipestifer]